MGDKSSVQTGKYWLTEEDFFATVIIVWGIQRQETSTMARLVGKWKTLAQELTKWGPSQTLPRKTTKDRILLQLEGLSTSEASLLNEPNKIQRDKLKIDFDDILMKEAIY